MGWNEPNNGKNPWGGKKQPPDLDDILKQIKANFFKLFSNSKRPSKKRVNKSSGYRMPFSPGKTTLVLGALIVVFWILSGIFIIDPAEQAAILRFGRYVETVGPGPHWILRFVDSKMVVNVDRVLDYSYNAQMLTKDENLVSVAVAVQYRIGDLEDYLFNVADAQESLKQATSSALRQVVGTTTLDQLITEGRDAWGNSVQDSLIKILDSYKAGIVIVNVSPQPARAPENVQDAFDDAIKAQEDEKRFKEQARAYEARVIPIAEGNAKRITEEAKAFALQTVLRAKGETAEFLELLPQYINAPFVLKERMYLDTMQHVLSKSSKILINTKVNNMFYLPLDKIWSQDRANSSSAPEKSKMSSASEAQSNVSMVDGRSDVRPTVQEGRTD